MNDSAENSIMQTISIAVSAILIAAGLITAPSLINNARDTNVQTDLANLAMAQEYRSADAGSYADTVSVLTAQKDVKTTLSTDAIGIETNADSYALFGTSGSGKTFWRASNGTATHLVPTPWPGTAPSAYPDGLTWPGGAQSVVAQRVTNLIGITEPSAAHQFESEFGGGSGTASFISDASSGYAPYQRNTFTSDALSDGHAIVASPRVAGINTLKPNTSYTWSEWVRPSVTLDGYSPTLFMYGSDNSTRSTGGYVNKTIPANTWTRLTYTFKTDGGDLKGAWPQFRLQGTTAGKFTTGSTLDVTRAMMVEGTTVYQFASGNTAGWKWNGDPYASTSTGKALAQ